MKENNSSRRPLRLREARVWRAYTGGALLGAWKGRGEEDGHWPEDWVGSVITARNGDRPAEGLSVTEEGVLLRDVIHGDPGGMLGEGHVRRYGEDPAVLVKTLDAACRLAIQVHPTREDAVRFFHSPFGKTEAWYVLATRPEGGMVYAGFREGMTEETWRALFDAQDVPGMLAGLHHFPVKAGDVILIEGGVPHAIDAGCLIAEIQEPTDLTLRTERISLLGFPYTDEDMHQGAGFEGLFSIFRYEALSEEDTLARWRKEPRPLDRGEGGRVDVLIGEEDTPCFSLYRLTVEGTYRCAAEETFRIAIVTAGEGSLTAGGETLALRQGDYLFLPAAMGEACWQGGMTVLLCAPPRA